MNSDNFKRRLFFTVCFIVIAILFAVDAARAHNALASFLYSLASGFYCALAYRDGKRAWALR